VSLWQNRRKGMHHQRDSNERAARKESLAMVKKKDCQGTGFMVSWPRVLNCLALAWGLSAGHCIRVFGAHTTSEGERAEGRLQRGSSFLAAHDADYDDDGDGLPRCFQTLDSPGTRTRHSLTLSSQSSLFPCSLPHCSADLSGKKRIKRMGVLCVPLSVIAFCNVRLRQGNTYRHISRPTSLFLDDDDSPHSFSPFLCTRTHEPFL
jgi:hypothetical protein